MKVSASAISSRLQEATPLSAVPTGDVGRQFEEISRPCGLSPR